MPRTRRTKRILSAKSEEEIGEPLPKKTKNTPAKKPSQTKKTKAKQEDDGSSSESDIEEPLPKKTKSTPEKKPSQTKKTKAEQEDDGSSSESDIENYLQPVDKLDLGSSFFEPIKKSEESSFDKIEKDIFAGMTRLSDSESEEERDITVIDKYKVGTMDEEPQASTSTAFDHLVNHPKKMEEIRRQIEAYKEKRAKEEANIDISKLLAAGEAKLNEKPPRTEENADNMSLHSSDFESCSDSEKEGWEEVKSQEKTEPLPKEGLQITVDMPQAIKKKKGQDLVAAMKRRLNRIKKENQVLVHKVHLLCWLGHGFYVNQVLNNEQILALTLSLLPSQKSYPDGRIDLKYLEQILKWFTKSIKLSEEPKPEGLTLEKLLQLQISRKEAYNKQMLVYIFICLLRSLGLQCRLALSFQVEPLRPTNLLSLSTKNDKKQTKSEKTNKAEVSFKIKDGVKNNPTQKKNDTKRDKKKTAEKKNLSNKKVAIKKGQTVKESTSKRSKPVENGKEKKTVESGKVVENGKGKKTIKSATEEKTAEDAKGKKTVEEGKGKKMVEDAKEKKTVKDEKGKKTVEDAKGKKTVEDAKEKKTVEKIKGKDHPKKEDKEQPNSKEISTDNRVRKKADNIEKNVEEMKAAEKAREDSVTTRQSKRKKEDQSTSTSNVRTRRSVSTSDTLKPPENTGAKKTRSKSSNDDKAKKSKTNTLKVKFPNLRKLRDRKPVVPQVDGTVDSDSDSEPVTKKRTNLKRLQKSPSKLLTSSVANIKDADSDEDFQQPKTSKFFGNKLDVRDDVVRLLKGRVKEQKQKEKGKLVKHKRKKKADSSEDDSDYVPEASPKKRRHSDDDFSPVKIKVKQRVQTKSSRKVISDDDEKKTEKKAKKLGMDVWVEVFVEMEEKWISVDVPRGQIHCVNELYKRATQPVTYVVVWNNDNVVKDVTARYCQNFNTITRKLRVDQKWWQESLKPFLGPNNAKDKEEDDEIERYQSEKPLPTSIAEFKNHPLYVLRRHLLKFEEIYPPDAPSLGFVRGEPVYSRSCVYVLHSRELWLKHARVVKPKEEPYKIVKARPKWDKLSNTVITDQLLEVFGIWQTTEYDPPTAENGIVPRNAYGNVELFKPCMLPKKTVHLRLPGLNKVARKLGIDCATAVVGFDFHGGWNHAVYDGFVVCEEFEDKLVMAWNLEQEEIERREEEKLEKRVYGNWKKLIRGLLIRERLKKRYDFGDAPKGKNPKKKPRVIADSDDDQ